MNYPINFNVITSKTEFHAELVEMHKKACDFLLNFKWCAEVTDSFIYLNLGSKICIFLLEIENSASSDDNYLWVVVGDIPSMYLDIHGPKTTKEVLEDYTNLADDWIRHIKEGKSIKDCYPFVAEPTLEMAAMLEKRSLFIKKTLIHNIDDLDLRLNYKL